MSRTLIRYWAYDQCFQNIKIKYTWKDLQSKANDAAERCGYEPIQKTQFFKDIKALKSPPYLAPIETYKENGQSYYRYSDPNFSLKKQELNELEAEQIKSALMVLSRFQGLPQFDWVHEVIPKIEQNFGLKSVSSKIIGFDENVDLQGINFMGELFNAILYQKALVVSYQSFKSSESRKFNLNPYYLKQYNNRWFLLGQDVRYDSLTVLSLDRIEGISEASSSFFPNTIYDFNEYFDDFIGVTRPSDGIAAVVELWLSPNQTPYVKTKPLHGTQKIKLNEDGSCIATIEVMPNFELEQMILSFGENCHVIAPQELRAKINYRLQTAVSHYTKIQ